MSSEYRDIVERFAEGLSPQEFALFEKMTEEQRKDVMSRAGVLRDDFAKGGITNSDPAQVNRGPEVNGVPRYFGEGEHKVQLAYITDPEAELLKELDLHDSKPPHTGPSIKNIPNYNDFSDGSDGMNSTSNANAGQAEADADRDAVDRARDAAMAAAGYNTVNFNNDQNFGYQAMAGVNPDTAAANAILGGISGYGIGSPTNYGPSGEALTNVNSTITDNTQTSSEAIANTNIAPNLGIIDSLFSGVYNFGTTQALKAENVKRKAAGLAEIDQDTFNAMNEQSFGIQDLVDRYFGSGITGGLTNVGTDLTSISMPGTLQALTAGFNTLTGQPALSASPTSGFYSSVPDDLSGMYKDTGSIGYGIRNALADTFGVEYSDPNVGRYTDFDKMLGAGSQINESYAGGMTQSDYASAVAAGAFADPALANAFREKEMMEKAEEKAAGMGNQKPIEIDYAAQAAAATAAITANYDSTQLAYFNDLVAKGYPEDYAASVVASILA
tara:strand:+ start:21 stop:1517 length:1497 start_codon:yes stop_codon:yes gene_type:complete